MCSLKLMVYAHDDRAGSVMAPWMMVDIANEDVLDQSELGLASVVPPRKGWKRWMNEEDTGEDGAFSTDD